MCPSPSMDGCLELLSCPQRTQTIGGPQEHPAGCYSLAIGTQLGAASWSMPPCPENCMVQSSAQPCPRARCPTRLWSAHSHQAEPCWCVACSTVGQGETLGTRARLVVTSKANQPRSHHRQPSRLSRTQPGLQRIHHLLNQSTRSAPPFVINYANQQTITLWWHHSTY